MLREQDRSFSTTEGLVTHFVRCYPMHPGTQVKAHAREWPEAFVTRMHGRAAKAADQAAVGIRTADPRHTLEIVATGAKPLPDLLDPLKTIPAVGGGVLFIVPGAEVAKMPLEYGMELVAAAGNVPILRRGRDRDCRAHIIVYERNQLFASDRELVHRSPHNVSHSPDAFSSLVSCEGAGDAVVMVQTTNDTAPVGAPRSPRVKSNVLLTKRDISVQHLSDVLY